MGQSEELVNLEGALACEFYPKAFSEKVTMGQNLAMCYDGGRKCGTSMLGQACCAPPDFQKCAESTHRKLAVCVDRLPRRKASFSDYANLRTFDVLSCLPEAFNVDVVLEFYTGVGTWLEHLVHFISTGTRIFSFEKDHWKVMDAAMLVQKQDVRLNSANLNATVLELTYHDDGIMLREPGCKNIPAHMALTKIHNVVRPGLWIVEGRPVRESGAESAGHNDGKAFWKVGEERGDFLPLFCKSFPSGTPYLLFWMLHTLSRMSSLHLLTVATWEHS